MKLRALQSTAVTFPPPRGLHYVRGPEHNDKDELIEPGEVIEVDDNFVVNVKVFEILTPPAGGLAKVRTSDGSRIL